ncbi:MAG: DUF4290 domain-containing protein [Leadbetterella sp.]
MKEYGSNVQKLVEHMVSIPEKEHRTKHAHILVELMRQIHPQMRDGADYSKKLWDDLYIMANFDLDVDSPFPPPPKEIMGRKPQQVPYSQNKLKHKIYGRNVELLILKAMIAETYDERKAFVSYLVKLMKSLFMSWNKDTLETSTCLHQILELSGGKLRPEVEDLLANGIIEDAGPFDSKQKQVFNSHGNNNYNRNNRNNNFRNNNNRNNNNRNGNNRFNNNNNNNNNRRRPN